MSGAPTPKVDHRCARCRERKALVDFRLDTRGRPKHCRPCSLLDTQEWRARHREALLARRRASYASLRAEGYAKARSTPADSPSSVGSLSPARPPTDLSPLMSPPARDKSPVTSPAARPLSAPAGIHPDRS